MIGFLVLTTIMIVNALSNVNNADIQVLTAEAYKTATDLGQSLMNEIVLKKFDENADTVFTDTPQGPYSSPTYPGGFTPPSQLGPDGTTGSVEKSVSRPDRSPFQSIAGYNDVDDYNGYSRITDTTNGLGPFRDSVLVYYVTTANPSLPSTTQQFLKRIEVWVTSDQYLKRDNKNIWVKNTTMVTPFKRG